MEERAKCLALLGVGALVGSVSTILLLKFRARIVNRCDERGAPTYDSRTYNRSEMLEELTVAMCTLCRVKLNL
ncbi:hypothetical protein C1H46_023385 [Malus baccata]|uniref:Uncharacterized protein n=1 Tax=Malus baccata TaxID=106549 RepID=A0A540LX20_MALBA|nr:hypothetical protein C1H46_023385 [Malus baccata]